MAWGLGPEPKIREQYDVTPDLYDGKKDEGGKEEEKG